MPLSPNTILSCCVVREPEGEEDNPAFLPIQVTLLAVVTSPPAASPIKTLLPPVVTESPAACPIAVLYTPVVLASKAK